MASSKEYLSYVSEQLSLLEEVAYRPMMGEYIVYYRGKVVGGVYDDRFLLKAVPAAKKLMPDAPEELPYEGAKKMLLVEDLDDKERLKTIVEAMYPELPAPKKK